MRRTLLIFILALLALPARAGTQLEVMLIRASKTDAITGPKLGDHKDFLHRNLPFFTGFDLVHRETLALPADKTLAMKLDYAVKCSGPQEKLTLLISRGETEIVRTTVRLRDGEPHVVGPFTDESGQKTILIMAVAR